MKKIFCPIIICIFLLSDSYAQNFWKQTNGPLMDGANVSSLVTNSNDHLFADSNDGIFRSTDNGDYWVEIINNLTTVDINAIAINQNNHIFIGTWDGIFLSTNNGDNWVQKNDGLSGLGLHISSLVINSKGHIYAGTSGEGIFLSTNGGENWLPVNNGLTQDFIGPLTVNSKDDIFLGCSEGVFKTTNNGENWIAVNNGLTNHWVVSLTTNKNDYMFICTFHRFLNTSTTFRSIDFGENWSQFQINNISNYQIRLFSFENSDVVYAGTDL